MFFGRLPVLCVVLNVTLSLRAELAVSGFVDTSVWILILFR